MNKKIYISYSHKDEYWKDRLLAQLKKKLIPESQVIVRGGRGGENGEDWQEIIEKDLSEADAAIPLISASFLASDFIRNMVIPRLLEYKNKKNLKIFPLIVSPCPWQNVAWLNKSRVFPEAGDLASSGSQYDIEALLTRFVSQLPAYFSDEPIETKILHGSVKGKHFEQEVVKILRLKGFDVEQDVHVAGSQIDILFKKKKPFGNSYDIYICECKNLRHPVGIELIHRFSGVRTAVTHYLQDNQIASYCDALIVSAAGFTREAKAIAKTLNIILLTYRELLSELMDSDS